MQPFCISIRYRAALPIIYLHFYIYRGKLWQKLWQILINVMQQRKPLYKTILFTKTQKKDGTYPVKLRITHTTSNNGERKTLQNYYAIPYSFNENDWNKIDAQNARGIYKTTREELNNYEIRARDVIDHLIETDGEFSFDKFKEVYFNTGNNTHNLYDAFNTEIDKLEKEERLSSATSVKCTLKSIKSFLNGKDVTFKDVTPQLLKSYEDWMVDEQNNSQSTVGIYMRNIRTLVNMQISKGLLELERYPFGRYKYQIPAVETRDKSISDKQMRAIIAYQPEEGSFEDKAKDIWVFLFLCNGMNVKDMCRLRYENFKEDHFTFLRAKTKSTRKKEKPIVVALIDDMKRIIKKWGNERSSSGYVFPFLNDKSTAQDERRITQNIVSNVNDNMNKIAKKMEFDINITTYTARKMYALKSRKDGASDDYISQSLGHVTTVITREHYLDVIDVEKQLKFTQKLLNF